MEDTKKKENKNIIYLMLVGIFLFIFFYDEMVRHWILGAFRPILFAFAMAYLLDNLVRFFERKLKITRRKSVAITVVFIILLAIYAGAIGIPNLVNSIMNLVNYLSHSENIDQIFNSFFVSLDNENILAIKEFVDGYVKEFLIQMRQSMGLIVKEIFTWTSSILSWIIYFVIAIYMLVEKKDLKARIKRMNYAFFDKKQADEFVRIVHKSDDIFSGFLVGKLIDSAIIGFLCFIILSIIDIPFASIISLIVGITNIIPYFGPFIGAVPAILITLLHSPVAAFWVAVVIIILQQFDGLILGPIILGDKVGVKAFWIITAVTLGGKLAGVWGMFLGVPVLVLIKSLLEENVDRKLLAKDMEDLEIENMNKKINLKEKRKMSEYLRDKFLRKK